MAKPEKVFKAGAIRVAVFRNTVRRADGQAVSLPKVTLEVRYRDKTGHWRGTPTLGLSDLPKAIHALKLAYGYLLGTADTASPN